MKYGLSEVTLKKILYILKQEKNIKQAILYGSRAKGTYKNGSDYRFEFSGR